jgi:predicted dehydrogenase
VLGFAGEVQGVARFHNLPKADASYDGIDVIGTKGALAVRGGFTKKLYRRRGHTFAGPGGRPDRWQEVPIPNSEAYFALDNSAAGRFLCQAMVRELIASIEEEREHVSSGQDGLVSLESLMAVYTSHRLGRPVTLPLAERRHPLNVWQEEMAG